MADALKWLTLRRAAAQAAPVVPSKSEAQEVPGEKSADGGFIEVDEIEQIEKILSRLKRRRSVGYEGSEILLEVHRL